MKLFQIVVNKVMITPKINLDIKNQENRGAFREFAPQHVWSVWLK